MIIQFVYIFGVSHSKTIHTRTWYIAIVLDKRITNIYTQLSITKAKRR